MTRLWAWWHGRHGQVVERRRTQGTPTPGLPGFTSVQTERALACSCGAERSR